ncbi:MAG: D-glycero-beta-D-manno-heptose 1,7-bisphosphate 7-phosphatase [Opitutales bacterium]
MDRPAVTATAPTQAVVLAGGLGTRLGELTKTCPKPLIPVGGKPFLEYLFWNLRRHGITRIVLSIGYLAEQIQNHFGDGSAFGLEIVYVIEAEPAGTGGAVKLCLPHLDERFFVLNGDTLFDVNYLALFADWPEGHRGSFIALRQVDDVSRYGEVTTDASGRVTNFGEKSASGPGWINGGIYLMERAVIEALPAGQSSLERDCFPKLVEAGQLVARRFDGFFIDIGLPETLAEGQTSLPGWQRRPASFLDRDGTLNVDHAYVHTPDKFDWTPDAIAAVRWLNEAGYLAIVITNQAGIGRGYYTEAQFHALMRWVNEELRRHGAHLDGVYFSPYHAEHGLGDYQRDSDCRKPNPGMLLRAIDEWPIDPAGSFMCGDSEKDVEAARRAHIQGIRYTGGSLLDTIQAALSTRAS